MSVFWRTIHLPGMGLPEVATNGFATGYGEEQRWYLRILHSKSQFRDLYGKGMEDLLPEDAGPVRRRIAQSCLPERSDQPFRQLEGQAASSICRSVYDLGEPPLSVLRAPLDRLAPFAGIVVSQKEGVQDGLVYGGGTLVRPFIEVCYSKRQLHAAFDGLRHLAGVSGLKEMDRKISRCSLPDESERAVFRIEAYAGLHLFIAVARMTHLKAAELSEN